MKNKKAQHRTIDLPEIEIIDLDKEPLRRLKETSRPKAAPADKGEQEAHGQEADQPSKGSGRIWIYLHILFAVLIVGMLGMIAWRIAHFGTTVDINDYEGGDNLADVMDHFVPAADSNGQDANGDGILTIVAFGNAPFADDRGSQDNLANIIADLSGGVVYNCSVGRSFLAAEGYTLRHDVVPMDAFNFYWLTTAFCMKDNMDLRNNFQTIFTSLGPDAPEDGLEAYNTLMSIDFNTVDVITLMYDASDYLTGHAMYNDQNSTDINQFTGNMEAGIELIQETYPHIRIIVLSPTYAYAVDEDGNYVSSESYRYGQDVLSTYVIKQLDSCYARNVSFVDNLYGTIHEGNAPEYLTDNIHINVAGRRLVAERFLEALNYQQPSAE